MYKRLGDVPESIDDKGENNFANEDHNEYEKVDEINDNDEGFVSIPEENNKDNENNNELEEQNVKEEIPKKENENENNIEDDDDDFIEVKEENPIDNSNNEKKEDIKESDFEFVEDEPNKSNIKNININDDNKEINTKKKISGFKDPDKIKNLMKSINIKPPQWAKNMTDSDFLNMAKRVINSKNKK